MTEKDPSSVKEDPYHYQNSQSHSTSIYDVTPSYDFNAPSPFPLALNTQKSPSPLLTPDRGHAFFSTFAPSPDGTRGPELSGDNPKGFMGHVKNFAPGKAPKKLLDPPPASFLRPPASGLSYGAFPVMTLLSKGSTLDRGFPYISPECGVGVAPHPFVAHDVNEQDWRQFLHDVRVAGSLSPMNRVVSGLAPLALPGVGIIFGFFVVKGLDSMMRRTKKGPASQLIDHWNHYSFHPRYIHVGLTQGPPKTGKGRPDRSQGADNNWR